MRLLPILAIIVSSSAFLAAAAAPDAGGPRAEGKHHQEMLEKFDANHDGKLDDGEKATARAALADRLKAKHSDLLAKLDADHDGQLSEAEMKAGRAELRAKALGLD